MSIVNCTPHKIVIVLGSEYVAEIRKNIATSETKIVKEFEPSGTLLNAKSNDEACEPFVIVGNEEEHRIIPTKKQNWVSVDELPNNQDFFIVSALYVAARKDLGLDCSNLLCIGDPVYESKEKPFPMGVLNLRRN